MIEPTILREIGWPEDLIAEFSRRADELWQGDFGPEIWEPTPDRQIIGATSLFPDSAVYSASTDLKFLRLKE